MEQLAMGQVSAFDKLYERYSNRIYGFILSRLKSKTTVDDIHQIVWEKVYRKAHTFKPGNSFSSWVFKITKNTIIDELRNSAKQNQLIEALEKENFLNNQKNLIHIPIEKLKPPYKEALEMRYIKDMEIGEIAKVLDMKEANTRKVISRGLKKLKILWKKTQ